MHCADASPSSRRAWIEIFLPAQKELTRLVALLAEGVDRNHLLLAIPQVFQHVALLAEGVDRNNEAPEFVRNRAVALLAEGVDRNPTKGVDIDIVKGSPSSRRAWIEISGSRFSAVLLKSPSSRRAWIEIA